MAIEYQLNEKQVAFMDDLFAGDTDEQTVLAKHNITADTYYQWLSDECFSDEFNRKLLALNHRTELLIAIKATQAAAKLMSLIDCEKEETARRACLDIINLPILKDDDVETEDTNDYDPQCPPITTETAGKLLAALAEVDQTEH